MKTDAFFLELVASQKRGLPRGIYSVCSAHRTVLEAAFLQAARGAGPVLIESTVNQVNQLGGYTGMTPEAFRSFVASVAQEMAFPMERVILGGDHLGPYPWRQESSETAMQKSRDLVAASVRAGYSKIHLDASMPLGGDSLGAGGALDPRVAAAREAELAAVAEAAFRERPRSAASAAPAYVIGTEVPTPGGAVASEGISVTRAEDLLETISLCREAFQQRGLQDAWERVCAVVAQPGVEFGDQEVHQYDRGRAAGLCEAARRVAGIVLEGHSTDYQTFPRLAELVRDGVAILKVGPALTFALRECLFSLECIEREMPDGVDRLSDLRETAQRAMVADPSHWRAYYRGSDRQQAFARRYSLSDRIRYYWSVPSVDAAVERLFSNLGSRPIPAPLLSQYLPVHHQAIRNGELRAEPRALVRESVRRVLAEYAEATGGA
jgi:D-tagatose-1,6-bisphosphate aldolase subunit GatZ/KbaZ